VNARQYINQLFDDQAHERREVDIFAEMQRELHALQQEFERDDGRLGPDEHVPRLKALVHELELMHRDAWATGKSPRGGLSVKTGLDYGHAPSKFSGSPAYVAARANHRFSSNIGGHGANYR
jgi:hypothetical protein